MKKIHLATIIIALFPILGFAQAGGNVIYEQNNRYKQNLKYNQDAEKVWDYRSDNKQNIIVLENQNNNEMLFTVNAVMNVKAVAYTVIFNIVQTASTAKEVNTIVNTKINGFKKELLKIGLQNGNIYTDMISLVPLYDYNVETKLFSKTYTEVPKGFEMQKNIHIRFENDSLLDEIVSAAAENEIYDLIKVEYYVDDTQAKYKELRDKSIEYMNEKILSYKKLGFNLDTISHILSEKQSVVYPIDRYKSYQAFSGTSIDALNSKNVTKVRKPITQFYNKLPYHKYDIVINPIILEPAVQFTYSITLKYFIKEKSPKNKYILVTPEGTVKTLKID